MKKWTLIFFFVQWQRVNQWLICKGFEKHKCFSPSVAWFLTFIRWIEFFCWFRKKGENQTRWFAPLLTRPLDLFLLYKPRSTNRYTWGNHILDRFFLLSSAVVVSFFFFFWLLLLSLMVFTREKNNLKKCFSQPEVNIFKIKFQIE